MRCFPRSFNIPPNQSTPLVHACATKANLQLELEAELILHGLLQDGFTLITKQIGARIEMR